MMKCPLERVASVEQKGLKGIPSMHLDSNTLASRFRADDCYAAKPTAQIPQYRSNFRRAKLLKIRITIRCRS